MTLTGLFDISFRALGENCMLSIFPFFCFFSSVPVSLLTLHPTCFCWYRKKNRSWETLQSIAMKPILLPVESVKSYYIGLVIIKDEVHEITLSCKERALVQYDEHFWLSVWLNLLIKSLLPISNRLSSILHFDMVNKNIFHLPWQCLSSTLNKCNQILVWFSKFKQHLYVRILL